MHGIAVAHSGFLNAFITVCEALQILFGRLEDVAADTADVEVWGRGDEEFLQISWHDYWLERYAVIHV